MSHRHGDTIQGIVYDIYVDIFLPNDSSTTIETSQNKCNVKKKKSCA